MSTVTPPQTPVSPQADHVVEALVRAELVHPTQRDRARHVVADALVPSTARPAAPASRGMSSLVEVVAYLGAALVLAAGALFLVDVWGALGFGSQVGVLAVLTVALLGGGLGARAGHADAVASRDPRADSRRRLSGTLLTAGALAAAFLVGMLVDRAGGTPDFDERTMSWTVLAACLVGLAVCAVGYRLAPTAVGVLGLAGGLATLAPTLVEPLSADGPDAVPTALALSVTAVLWLVLVERRVLAEQTLGRVLGVLLALGAAQTPVVDGTHPWVGYLLTALVAVAGTALYLRRGAWPYLGAAVAAVTLVVPEAVSDWTDGGLGAVGAVLVTGVTLLLASLLGAWLRARRS